MVKMEENPLIGQIDDMLPQTQCGQCGFPGCKPYAVALAQGEADINQCPPGGDDGIRQLSELLGRAYKPLAPGHGVEKPAGVALIDEQVCIGCTLCIEACPVDAIAGASKQMHTVIASLCTGCELCIPPCPVDCITMKAIPEAFDDLKSRREGKIKFAHAARSRYELRQLRLQRDAQEKAARLAAKLAAHKQRTTIADGADEGKPVKAVPE